MTPLERVDRLVRLLELVPLTGTAEDPSPLALARAELLQLRGAIVRQERKTVAMIAGAIIAPVRRSA